MLNFEGDVNVNPNADITCEEGRGPIYQCLMIVPFVGGWEGGWQGMGVFRFLLLRVFVPIYEFPKDF